MSINILVPSLGPSIEEAVLVKWLVGEGDFVRRGMPIFSVETDKTVVDCESVDEGYLHKIVVPEGSTVRVDQILGELRAERSEAVTGGREGTPTQVERRDDRPATLLVEEPQPAGAPGVTAGGPVAGEVITETALERGTGGQAATDRIRISPRARRMAREVGVPIERLPGSGPTGRIIRCDVEAFVNASVGVEAARVRPAAKRAVRTGRTRDVPLTTMRRTIARRLTESARDTPVFFATTKVEADHLVLLREQVNRVSDARVSINDIIVKACALALRRCPQVNATFHDDHTRLHEDVDIAVAVAVEDGLVTPIVRNADGKGLLEVAAEMRDLAERARLGKLAQEEYQGGTFTVSNLGMYGVSEFTALINPPQCAILAVGAIDREVYLDAGAVQERRIMKITLTADHRAIDGALSARFLSDLKVVLENPASVLV